MAFTVAIRFADQAGQLSSRCLVDHHAVFDLPHDARQYLLALVADEIATSTRTECVWITPDAMDVVQADRPAPFRHRRYEVVILEELD